MIKEKNRLRPITIKVSEEYIQKIKSEAEKESITQSVFVRNAVEAALNKKEMRLEILKAIAIGVSLEINKSNQKIIEKLEINNKKTLDAEKNLFELTEVINRLLVMLNKVGSISQSQPKENLNNSPKREIAPLDYKDKNIYKTNNMEGNEDQNTPNIINSNVNNKANRP